MHEKIPDTKNHSLSVISTPNEVEGRNLPTELSQSGLCFRVSQKEDIDHVYTLMSHEFISHGGLLRDLSPTQLSEIAKNGEVWALSEQGAIIAAFTMVPIQGSGQRQWWYINNGVLDPHFRHQGGERMIRLHRASMDMPRKEEGYIVISIVHSIFLTLGFSPIDLPRLTDIDPRLSAYMSAKTRPGVPATVFIRRIEHE